MAIAIVEAEHLLARDHLPLHLAERCGVILRMHEVDERPGQELLHRPAENVGDRRAHSLEVAIGARDDEEVERQGEEALELRFRALPAGKVPPDGDESEPAEPEGEEGAAQDDPLGEGGAALRALLALEQHRVLVALHLLDARPGSR